MLSFVLIAKVQAFQNRLYLQAHPLPTHSPCVVDIQGAVKNPGTYQVPPGTLLKKILKKSRPLPNADLSPFCLDQRIEDSMTLVVSELSEISISILGVGDELIHCTVPLGTKISDLKKYIELDESEIHVKKILKRRRVLRNGETVDFRGNCKPHLEAVL